MTHFYELYKGVCRGRRKVLAKFIHELKKLCGCKYHVHVVEMLEECDEDYLFIDIEKLNDYGPIENEITLLCDFYCIPRNNILLNNGVIEISLYTDV